MKKKKLTSLQKLTNKNKIDSTQNQKKSIFAQILLLDRLKAFITDIFMIYMPILYVATYAVLGSKEAFQNSQITLFICFCLYGLITSILFYKKSQSLGYMYAEIILLKDADDEKSKQNISFFIIIARFLLFCLSMALVFGLIVPFIRKDKRTFHDSLCGTKVIKFKRN